MGMFRYIGLGALEAKGRRAVSQAVTDSANDLVEQAGSVTPIETGALRASIQADPPEIAGDVVKVVVHTGGEVSDYAVVQHEHEEFHHDEGQAKYIEEPLIRNRTLYREHMRRAMNGEF